jgi:hypothetical protein
MTTSKIVVRLAGGLGNQLFQFAAALSIVQRKNLLFSNILLDTRFLASYEAKHVCEIGFMSKLFLGVQVAPQLPTRASIASRFRLAKIIDKKLGSFELISSVSHLNKACTNLDSTSTIVLDGYFQDPDIIFSKEERNRIYTSLIMERRSLIEQVMIGSLTIGIHIRRGDYITSQSAAKVFRNISMKYYDEALQKLRRGQKVLVFSDDRELSAFYATKIGGIDVRNLKLTLQDEFCLLMACDDHIIANSTFSWWASYLGHKSAGRVISPKCWYHDIDRSQANPLLLPYFELIDA